MVGRIDVSGLTMKQVGGVATRYDYGSPDGGQECPYTSVSSKEGCSLAEGVH